MLKKVSKLLLSLLFLCAHTHGQWLKKFESSDNLYAEAKREIDLKHYQKAINMCSKGIEISPKNLDIYLLRGRAYSLLGKIDSARLDLNHVIERNPKYRDAYIYLVNMEAVACNYLQAIEYADNGLKYFPNDRDLLLKKLDVYNKEGDWIESNRLAEYLFDRFSNDPYIRTIYLDYKLTLARQYAHKGYIEIAKRAYESVLEQDPLNKEAMQAVYNLDVRSGNYISSLAFINRALQTNPNSYEYLMKKVNILDAMGRYSDALDVLDKLLKLYPNDAEVRKISTYMRMQSGRSSMNADPYMQFQAVLERDPSNTDALNYVINIANSRGQYADALYWVNQGLKKNPGDKNLLNKKLGILTSMKSYGSAAAIAEGVYKSNPTPDNKANYIELRTLSARGYMAEQEYDSAIHDLKGIIQYDHNNMGAINMLVSAYNAQKRFDDAIHVVDEALTYYPGNENLLFKKAGILESYQHYSEAAQISKDLLQKYPDKRTYLLSFVDQSLAAGRQSLAYDDYSSTTTILKEVLEKQPDNLDALNYLINIESAFKQYDSAVAYTDQALHYYPESKDLLFKKSSIYADAHRFRDAYTISGQLHNDYPYNVRFRDAYIDHLLGSGKQYMVSNQPDSALGEYAKVLEVNPTDSNALVYSLNILSDQHKDDSVLSLASRGRAAYPNNPYYLVKKASVYESQKKWEDAWATADTLSKLNNLDAKSVDYVDYLNTRRLRNQWVFGYLRTKFDYSTTLNTLATAQYTRFFNKGSITGRVNYAGRQIGAGFQFEADAYYNVIPKWTLFGTASYCPVQFIFPQFKAGLSVSHAFPKGWEGEIGFRYLKADSATTISPTAAISRDYDNFFFSVRGYYINANVVSNVSDISLQNTAKKSNYFSGVLTTRYYLNPLSRGDWFSVIFGYGNAPDDFSRNFQLSQIISYQTVSVGAGYTKQFKYRTSVGLFGSWYNLKVEEKLYHNQYDVYLQLLHKFNWGNEKKRK